MRPNWRLRAKVCLLARTLDPDSVREQIQFTMCLAELLGRWLAGCMGSFFCV